MLENLELGAYLRNDPEAVKKDMEKMFKKILKKSQKGFTLIELLVVI